MKKNGKKITLILVLALILSLAIPALAQNTEITGAYEDLMGDIGIILPGSTGTAIINPYSLPVEIKSDGNETTLGVSLGKVKMGQVATMPLVGCNLSEFDLDVGVTVSGVATGDFKFSEVATTADDTGKLGQIYFQMKNANYDIGLDTSVNAINGFDGANVFDIYTNWAPSAAAPTDIIVSKTATTTEDANKVTIEKAVKANPTDTELTPQATSYFVARLCGNVVKAPKSPWDPADGFTTTVTWNIEPTPD